MSFALNLRSALIDSIICFARYGWGPDDFLHALGPKSHSLLYEAAPFIPAHIESVPLRKAWLRIGPPDITKVSEKDLRRMIKLFRTFGPLDDSKWLSATDSDPEYANLTTKQQKARQRIEKLLRKAESTQYSEEAEALISKAHSLRQSYRIQEACEPENLRVITRRVYITPPWVRQQHGLLTAIAHFNGAATLLLGNHGISTVFGAPSDVEHVADLFHSLARQCSFFMTQTPGAKVARANKQTSSYRRSFWIAYTGRISEILEAASSPGTVPDTDPTFGDTPPHADYLPLLHARHDRAVEALNKAFPNIQQMTMYGSHPQGFADGTAAAERSHFSGDGAGLGGQRSLSS